MFCEVPIAEMFNNFANNAFRKRVCIYPFLFILYTECICAELQKFI
jgi:hypothetical protein